jgi:hypothetical protein
MRRPRQEILSPGVWDLGFAVLCAALVLSLIRAIDQPGVDLGLAGTTVTVTLADAALAVLAALVLLELARGRRFPASSRLVVVAGVAFSAWLVASAAPNGASAVVAGVKLAEYGALALGVLLFVQRLSQLWVLAGVLVAVTTAASAYGLLGFLDAPLVDSESPGARQPSFLGEHDFAALATMSLALGLAALWAPRNRLGRLALVAGLAGGVGVVLGAALAGLIGVYLCAGAIAALAVVRGVATWRALAATAAVLLAVSAGVLALRSGDLTALARFLGVAEQSEVEYENASSWSQRLIYAYVGGRIFLDRPVTGTGWHGTLPAEEYERYLPDAHARFPDQPAGYFPTAAEGFLPQQTYDQVLYELGLVGAALFFALLASAVAAAARAGRSWPAGDPDELAAYLPLGWMGALLGGLAGAALFGGTPLAAILWLTLGIAALAPSLVPPARLQARERELPRPAALVS